MKIKIFVISLFKSKRLKKITNIMNKLKLKFHIVKAVDGRKLFLKKKLHKLYNKKKTLSYIGRELSPEEVGAAASHLKVYKLIIKKKIKNAIIIEDDAIPSKNFPLWVNSKITLNDNEIVSFNCYNNGLIKKKPTKRILDFINLHQAKTHLHSGSFYQINYNTCKKIIKKTKGTVISFSDWPFNIFKDKIKLFITLPLMGIIDDKGFSSTATSRNLILKEKSIFLKKIFTKNILNFMRYFYYLLLIPIILRRYKNFSFYYEQFFHKYLFKLLNTFTNNYLDLNDVFYNSKYYSADLRKYLNLSTINKNEKKYSIQ